MWNLLLGKLPRNYFFFFLLPTSNEFVFSSIKKKIKCPHTHNASANFTGLLAFLWVSQSIFAYCRAQQDTSTASHD